MNRDNIKIVRDHLLSLPADAGRFDMRWWTGRSDGDGRRWSVNSVPFSEINHDCGTCACIAGWAATLVPHELTDVTPEDVNMIDLGRKLFGLSQHQATDLFAPWANSAAGLHPSWITQAGNIPPRAGAMVLDHLLATGDVDWSVIGPMRCFDHNGEEITE